MAKILCLIIIIISLGSIDSSIAQNKKANNGHSFVGTKKCGKCHFKQKKSWKKTKMAKAFTILKAGERAAAKKKAGLDPQKDYSKDPKCLPCHTTGYGKPGGFVSEKKTPQLAGVSCEMCHGAGGEYTKKQYMSNKNKSYKRKKLEKVGMISAPTKEVCTVCHNKKSPFYKPFDFDKRKDDGTHKHYALKYEHD